MGGYYSEGTKIGTWEDVKAGKALYNKKIAELSDGRVMLAAGTLYGALSKLEQNQGKKL